MKLAPASSPKTPHMPRSEDAAELKTRVRRAGRLETLRAAGLIAPLFLFLCIFFFFPVSSMLFLAVDNPELREGLPRTVIAIRDWNGIDLPSEAVYAALVQDVRDTSKDRGLLGRTARRLNYEISGFRGLLLAAPRGISELGEGPYKQAIIELDQRWGEQRYWAAIKRNAGRFTDHYLLAAVDRERDANNAIVATPTQEAIFIDIYGRTFWVSALVAFFCLLLGYPFAYLLAGLSTRVSHLLMFFVLLPFWTALLARTTAWIVLLQREGVVNDLLRYIGFTTEPLPLVFSRTGVIIAMTHVLLPFVILPLYSVMKGVDPLYMRVAQSLGAHPFLAFWKIYFPMTLPGVAAGGLLVFILSLGFYVTPALVGGSRDQLISTFIALYTDTELNWGQGSALAAVLLFLVLALYGVYYRLVGGKNLQFR